MATDARKRKRNSLNPLNRITRSRSSTRPSGEHQTAAHATVSTSSHSEDSPEPSTPLPSGFAGPPESPETTGLPPIPPSDLWIRAFREANDKTQKWLRKHALDCTSLAQKGTKHQIEEIIGLIENTKLSEQNDKPLKIEIGNQKIVVREYVADVVAFIAMIVDASAALAPEKTGVPWGVAKAVLKIPVKQIEQKAALLGTVQWFARIVRRGQICEALYTVETTDKRSIQNLHDGLFEVYKAALELLATSETLFSEGTPKQTLSAILKPDGATGQVKDLFDKEQRLTQEVLICEGSRSALSSKQTNDRIETLRKQLDQLYSPLSRVDKGVASLLAKVETRELEKWLDFISNEMFGKSHAAVAEARIENTGRWLLDNRDFRAWQDIPSSSAVLCLKGTVGTGKTFLTSRVIDYVKQTLKASQHDEGFAYFYCNRNGPSMQDPIAVLRSFVRQLAGKAFDEPDLVQSSLIQKCQTAKREGRELGYKDCRDLILESFNLYSKTTIVLDALDETDITIYNLCTILMEMMETSRKPVKVFISSRPDREYMKAFEDKCIITVDASNQQADIELFLAEKLYSTRFFTQRRQDIQEKIKNVFATRGCGMFRWVFLQVKNLERRVTDEAIHSWAHNLPKDLMAAYDQLWEDIKERDEFDVALAERAIMWVLCSIKPLKTEWLLEAVRYVVQGCTVAQKEKQTQQQILSLCQDLLTIDEQRGVWMLPHASVAEYFEKRGWMNWRCDAFAAKVSLGCLEKFQPDKIRNDDFACYIHDNWHRHVGRYDKWLGSMEKGEADPDLVVALERFLGSPGESSANYRKWANAREDKSMQPANMAIIAMCRYGFYYTLRDWWMQGRITTEMALQRDGDGYSMPGIAASGDFIIICKHLIRLVGFTHPDANRHYGILNQAIQQDQFDLLSFLILEANADANFAPPGFHRTAAQWAAIYQPKMLQWMIEQGRVDLDRENDSGHMDGNILITAASIIKVESVRILLKAGANANAAVQHGEIGSALATAANFCGKQHLETIQLLLDSGADPNLPLKVGQYGSALEASVASRVDSGLHGEEMEENRRNVQQLLLEAGADPTAVFERGQHGSALAAAAFYGRRDFLKSAIDRVGVERAIEALRRSRHPKELKLRSDEEVQLRKDTIKYLAEEVGAGEEILDTIGLWDVEPGPEQEWDSNLVLSYTLPE